MSIRTIYLGLPTHAQTAHEQSTKTRERGSSHAGFPLDPQELRQSCTDSEVEAAFLGIRWWGSIRQDWMGRYLKVVRAVACSSEIE